MTYFRSIAVFCTLLAGIVYSPSGADTYVPYEPSTGSTAVLLIEQIEPLPIQREMVQGLLIGQCQSLPPSIIVPGGVGWCVPVACRSRRGSVVGHVYICPPGWRVENGQAVPWPL